MHSLPPVSDYPTLLDLIGSTPIVRLDRFGFEVQPQLLAKLEFLNPGGSNKDRIGLAMIEAAEREGKLRPGGTIVEPTSGNTGVGLAIAAAAKGYRCIFVMPDKMSQEKISTLRAYGAEVVITPTAVEHDSPESYYSVSDRLAEEIPGGFKPDQYSNLANPEAHYETTAPEIWEQTDGGQVDAIVISVGTGGTISGIGRYFKERRPEVLIVGADPEGSVYTEDAEHPLGPYLVEGIGKDTWPQTMDPEIVDEWVRVSDRESFLTARRLAREEGLLVGGSCGSTAFAALQVARRFGPEARILMVLPDGGRSYLSKFYDDNWMIQYGFMERTSPPPTIEEVLRFKHDEESELPDLVTIDSAKKVGAAIELMQRYGISQLPVVRHGTADSVTDIVGSIQERSLLDRVFKNPDALNEDIAIAMQPPLASVDVRDSLDDVFADLSGPSAAVVVGVAGCAGRDPHPLGPARVPRLPAHARRARVATTASAAGNEACGVPAGVRLAQLAGVEGADPLEELELVAEVGAHHLRPVGCDREGDAVLDEGAEGGADGVLVGKCLREQVRRGADLEHDPGVAEQAHQVRVARGEDAVADAVGPERLDDVPDLLRSGRALLADVDRDPEAGGACRLDHRLARPCSRTCRRPGRGPAMSMPTTPRSAQAIALSTMIAFCRASNVRSIIRISPARTCGYSSRARSRPRMAARMMWSRSRSPPRLRFIGLKRSSSVVIRWER